MFTNTQDNDIAILVFVILFLSWSCYIIVISVCYYFTKQVITFLQKLNYIRNTYKFMKTFVKGTVIP